MRDKATCAKRQNYFESAGVKVHPKAMSLEGKNGIALYKRLFKFLFLCRTSNIYT